MRTRIHVRFTSGREETYEIEFWGGPGVRRRVDDFLKSPEILLRTKDELIIIPASAVECVRLSLPDSGEEQEYLSDIRRGKKVDE